VAVSQRASFPIGNNIIFLNHLIGDSLLLLYEHGIKVHGTLCSFIESGLKSGEPCLFAYDNTEGRWPPETVFGKYIEAGKLYLLSMYEKSTLEGIKYINRKFAELCRRIASGEDGTLRMCVDFGGLPNRSNINDILGCVRNILKKKDEVNDICWGMARCETKKLVPFPIQAITAFNVDYLPVDVLRELFSLHRSAMILTRNQHMISMLNYHPPELPDLPPVETISRQVLVLFIKKHLETIVLYLLSIKPMCGYDLIRTIYQRFHTFLSQGTIYPLLYSLEGKGLLNVVKSGSPRSKVYAMTEEGKRVAERKIEEFINVQRYLLQSIQEA